MLYENFIQATINVSLYILLEVTMLCSKHLPLNGLCITLWLTYRRIFNMNFTSALYSMHLYSIIIFANNDGATQRTHISHRTHYWLTTVLMLVLINKLPTALIAQCNVWLFPTICYCAQHTTLCYMKHIRVKLHIALGSVL